MKNLQEQQQPAEPTIPAPVCAAPMDTSKYEYEQVAAMATLAVGTSAAVPMTICRSSIIAPSVASNPLVDSNEPSSASKKAIDANAKESRQPFPVKVYEMLQDADPKKFSHLISWNPAGTGFMVHDKDKFTDDIVPLYFNLTKYKSFQRQLSLYGFQRVTVGPNKGLRFHDKLRRGQADLVRQMKPVGYKPRNLARLVERQNQRQREQQQQQQQQIQHQEFGNGGTNITTTTTTTIKMTTTSTTSVGNSPAPPDISTTDGFGTKPSPDLSTSILPVVSTGSLMKQEDQETGSTIVGSLQHTDILDQTNDCVHNISLEAKPRSAIPPPADTGAASSNATADGSILYGMKSPPNYGQQNSTIVGRSKEGLEKVSFEGMSFHPMVPTRELTINVKLKLLEEFNPASSLLQLASKYVTPGYTTEPIVSTTPAPSRVPSLPTIDAVDPDRPSLLEPFTDLVSATASAAAASTASAIAALHSASADSAKYNGSISPTSIATHSFMPTTITPNVAPLESRCMDALDFHTINLTSAAATQMPE